MAIVTRKASITGSMFYNKAGDVIARLRPGQEMRLVREADNKYDKNAIGVYVFERQLGYVPRGLAAELAPIMDGGTVISVVKANGWGVIDLTWDNGVAESL